MVEEKIVEAGEQLPLEGVGDLLRRAREQQGLAVEKLAAHTRISQRHIELIEQGRFSDLPGRTYAFGFTRTCARELGLDENALVAQLREELTTTANDRPAYQPGFEPGDPAKVPPPGIVIASALGVLVLAAGIYVFYASYFAPGADPAPLVAAAEAGEAEQLAEQAGFAQDGAAAAASTPAMPDQVVFTALEEGIWVSFYEAGGRRLEQKLMARGERFVIPSGARNPRVWTGRPDAFAITIGGEPVPKLAEEERVVRDVSVTAQALRERVADTAAAAVVEAPNEASVRPATVSG